MTLGYYESCPCGRATEDSVPACVSRGKQIKSTHTHRHRSTQSFLCLRGPVAKETRPGLNTSSKYLGGFRSGSEG